MSRRGLQPAAFAELHIAPSSSALSLTSGTLSRVSCRAVLPGKDEGSLQTAEQFFLVAPTASPLAVVHGSMGNRAQTSLNYGTSAHKAASDS